ncbi:MAG: DNA gyrase subunit A [Patescibacteria group bacterium]
MPQPKPSSKPNKPDNPDTPPIGANIGYVKPREIVTEMQESYIDYAMSVIVSRALPDVRDGLKPVHRKILYTMHEDGLRHTAKFRKSATVVGSTLGRYHPHGDQAVYGSMARMAQNFSLRYPLIDGQGNWGSVDDPDEFAAMRYTEARLSRIGEEMLRDIERDTVNFVDNYDTTRTEPAVLPSPLPQLLLNGTLGIAVGMATNIPTHNLTEVIDATVHLLENPQADTEDLFNFIKGPDFPTGGLIYNRKEMLTTYAQGKGPIVMRGKAEVTEDKKGNSQIIVTEIPFQVRKSSLLEQIAALAQEKKIEGVKDVRDESDKEGIRIVIDLAKAVYPQKILNRLYKFTDLQRTFHLNMLALVDGIQPKVLSLVEMLDYFLKHRVEVVTRRAKYDLEKAKERAHILEGLAKALDNIDAVIKTIRASKNREDAHKNLVLKFKFSTIQANAILEMRLAALAHLEREKIAQELKEILAKIKELSEVIKSPAKIKGVVKKELLEIKETFGDARRTKIFNQAVGEIAEEDLIPQEETVITLTQGGYIKRMEPQIYKVQQRGGKGILGLKTSGEDVVEHFISCQTHDSLFFFTDSGKVFNVKAYELPNLPRAAKGRGVANFLEISSQEKVLSVFPWSKKDLELGIKYLVIVTKNGIIKRVPLEQFENVRRSGLRAITLRPDDLVKKVVKTRGKDHIIIITKKGQGIRIPEEGIRAMGRTAAGVKGIRMKKGDEIIGMEVIGIDADKQHLLIISENGCGKRTAVSQFKTQGRGGSGIKAAQITAKTGDLVATAALTGQEEDIIVVSKKGQVIRTNVNLIPILGRATQGVKVMRLDGDKVASVACV